MTERRLPVKQLVILCEYRFDRENMGIRSCEFYSNMSLRRAHSFDLRLALHPRDDGVVRRP